MLHVDMTLADHRLIFDFSNGQWHGTVTDTVIGASKRIDQIGPAQFSAAIAIALSPEGLPCSDEIHTLAEEIFEAFSETEKELFRFIP